MAAAAVAFGAEEIALGSALTRARAGDPAAFGELYSACHRRILGRCRRILGEQDAEDAAAEVFVKALRALTSHDPSRPFLPWLRILATHHCIDKLRRQQARRRVIVETELTEAAPAGIEPSPLSEVLGREARRRLRACIAALPPHYRLPLVLRYYNEMSYLEIARTLGIGRNQVALSIFRAKRALRRQMAGLQPSAVQAARRCSAGGADSAKNFRNVSLADFTTKRHSGQWPRCHRICCASSVVTLPAR